MVKSNKRTRACGCVCECVYVGARGGVVNGWRRRVGREGGGS